MKIKKIISISALSMWMLVTGYLIYEVNKHESYEVLFSPDDHPQNRLIQLIDQTNKSIKVAVYTFTNHELAKALMNAKKRGVKVEIITDQSSLKSQYGKVNYLNNNGIPVSIYPIKEKTRSLMHHKFALFQNRSGKNYITLGSLNWTKAACQYNQENLTITDNTKLYGKFNKWFDTLKLRSRAHVLA